MAFHIVIWIDFQRSLSVPLQGRPAQYGPTVLPRCYMLLLKSDARQQGM